MKAHDVRHLRICPDCRKLGDDRDMICIGRGHWHSSCAFKAFGLSGILKLPRSVQDKFSLADIGPKAMKQLIAALTKGQRP